MRMLKLFLIVLILSGCGSTPKVHQSNNWDKLNTTEIQITEPIKLPIFPKATLEDNKIVYSLEDAKTLDQFKIASKSNYAISLKLVEELKWSDKGSIQFIKAGQLTEQALNVCRVDFATAEEGRREEQKWRIYERWGWQSLFVVLTLGL